MWWLLILLVFPSFAHASCVDDDPAYDLAINQGNYEGAFAIVARDLHLSPEEEGHFKIIPGFSPGHDDRNGQADPDNLELRLDPGLFLEGTDGACQGMAHEIEHLKQFQKDRQALHAYYEKNPPAGSGWDHCDRDPIGNRDPKVSEEDAYDCLEDNDLVTHDAADEIDAVLAQVPLTPQGRLRDEDLDYLYEQLKAWRDNIPMIQDQSNISYYLPEIKKRDTRIFCRGVHQIQEWRLDSSPFYNVWQMYCRVNPGD